MLRRVTRYHELIDGILVMPIVTSTYLALKISIVSGDTRFYIVKDSC